MRTFKQYLNEVVSIRELYHGTTTGQNNRNIQSFKNGIDPTRAHGYGQGAGFFCFADAQSAQKHAAGLLKPRDEDSTFVTGAELSGLPMVVGVAGKLNPYDWDVDYELNKEQLVRFIYDHYEKFAGMQFQHGGQPHQMNPNKNRVLVGFRVIDGDGNGRGYSGNDSNTDEAVLIKNIIQQFSQHNPEVVNTFKTIFFDNMTPGIAVKYVGSAPLKVTSMQVLNGGTWQKI